MLRPKHYQKHQDAKYPEVFFFTKKERKTEFKGGWKIRNFGRKSHDLSSSV